jgi:hypothetical protein
LYVGLPPEPKAENIKTKTIGKITLKTIAIGLANMALNPARVMDSSAVNWL